MCLAGLLLLLLNPNTDLQSRTQARVFFTSSHIVIAIAIGYGITLLGGVLATQYTNYITIKWWVPMLVGLARPVLKLVVLREYSLDLLDFLGLAGAVIVVVVTQFLLKIDAWKVQGFDLDCLASACAIELFTA